MLSALDSLITAITSPIRQLYYLIQRVTPGSQAFGRLSLPMRWAIITFLCLSIALVAALIRIMLASGAKWIESLYFLCGVPLVFVISLLVYWFVVFWLKEEPSKYPDIDRVMHDGLQQLTASGISAVSTPIFLVLGTEDVEANRRLLEAANLKLPVHAPKAGEGALSFLASKDAIWIMPNSCNAISRLSHSSPQPTAGPGPVSEGPPEEEEIQGTVGAEDIAIDPEDQDGEWGRAVDKQDDEPSIEGGTIALDDFDLAKKDFASAPAPAPPKKILGQDLAETEDRLRYICKLIKKARRNVCPINGVLTTIPFELIENHHKQLSLALQKDLKVLRNELQVRVANTLLVTGMENEPGFIEMTRRLGPQRIAKQRIGKGSDVWVSPERMRLAALAKHATAVFEDQIFDLFQHEDSLRNKQNAKLFSLLSRMRGTFASHLTEIMETGFGFDPSKQPELADQQFLFSGCYFAACGPEKQRQAFVASAISKVVELCDDIEWTPSASRQDARYRRFANWVALIGLLSILGIVAFLAFKYRGLWWPSGNP